MPIGGRLILPIAEPCISNLDQLVTGATLTVYTAGGLGNPADLASLFADAALATPIANPQTSDAAGRFFQQSTTIWADDSQAYDCSLNYNNGTSFTFLSVYTVGPPVVTSSFAPINSPTFTGVPQAPTPATNDNSNKIATTGFVKAQAYAPLASPALTGVPTAPTAANGTDTTQLATTAFVQNTVLLSPPSGAPTGFFKFLGVILQWQSFSLGAPGGSTQAITWPTTFPNNVLGTPWVACNGAASQMIGVTSVTTSGCTVAKGNGDTSARTGIVWAIGQ